MTDTQEGNKTSAFLHTPNTGIQQSIIVQCIMPSFTAGDAGGPVSMQHQVYILCFFLAISVSWEKEGCWKCCLDLIFERHE